MSNPHPHAKAMMEYAQDAAETDKPWERWQFMNEATADWTSVNNHPAWNHATQYRRKPKPLECWVIVPERHDSLEVSRNRESAESYASKWGGRVVHMREVTE